MMITCYFELFHIIFVGILVDWDTGIHVGKGKGLLELGFAKVKG